MLELGRETDFFQAHELPLIHPVSRANIDNQSHYSFSLSQKVKCSLNFFKLNLSLKITKVMYVHLQLVK